MKNLKNLSKVHVIIILSSVLLISILLNIASFGLVAEAQDSGRREMYMDLKPAIDEAIEALESIRPEKNEGIIPKDVNSKGEAHPDIIDSQNIADFVFNNCTEPVIDNFDAIVAYAESRGIHPALPFAISWADTGCGKNMATPNNFGNVGNNDRGDRMGFATPIEGFNAIVDVLHNKYMAGNTNIGQLSGGGRTKIGATHPCSAAPAPYKCYATSPENWHNNVTRALGTMLDWSTPVHDWNFRI